MKSCSKCGAAAGDAAIKCPQCRALLVSPVGIPSSAPSATSASPYAPGPPPQVAPPQPQFAPPPPPPPGAYSNVWTPAPMTPPGAYSTPRASGSVKRWVIRVSCFVLGFFVVAGIINARRDDGNPYSHANQEAFVSGCMHSGSAEGTCRCAIRWISQNVPVEDYKAYGRMVTSGNYTASQTPDWVFTAMHGCIGASG